MDHLVRVLLFSLLLVDFSEGVSDLIQTQDPVRSTEGEDTRLSCLLTQPRNVLQVTWQKMLSSGGTEDVSSYNKRFGTKINPPFVGRVDFEDPPGLQNSTIVVRKVTRSDAGCYRCLFNAYPDGAIYTKTCLIVHDQPEPWLQIIRPNGSALTVVSCWAVSLPGLTVTLEVAASGRGSGSSSYSTVVHSANADGTTLTVNSTLTLLDGVCNNNNNTQVRCVVSLPSGLVREVTQSFGYQQHGVFETCEPDQSGYIRVCVFAAAAILGLAVIAIIVAGLTVRFRRKQARPNDEQREMKRINQTMTHNGETSEHLVSHDNIDQT